MYYFTHPNRFTNNYRDRFSLNLNTVDTLYKNLKLQTVPPQICKM